MPDSQFVRTELNNGVGRITLNRSEKRNALTRGLIERLDEEICRLKSDCDLRLLILAAEGPVFCAGMDLAEMQQRAGSDNGSAEWQRDSEVYARLLASLFTADVPTVVQLQGPVLAGGVGLVLACDFIIASEGAFFSLPEPQRGITAAMVTPLLIYRAGAGVAGQLLLSGQSLSAARALTLGLCYDVVAAENLSERVTALATSILAGSQSALSITKRHLEHCSGVEVVSQIKQSIAVSAEARETADAREGLAAFLEKRKPAWTVE